MGSYLSTATQKNTIIPQTVAQNDEQTIHTVDIPIDSNVSDKKINDTTVKSETIISDTIDNTVKSETIISDTVESTSKVTVEPITVTPNADVIKKNTKKRKNNHKNKD